MSLLVIEDVHRAFEAVNHLSLPGRRVVVIRQITSWFRFRVRALHLAMFMADHALLPLRAAAGLLRGDLVLLREFSHVLTPYVIWPLRPWSHRIVLLVHRTVARPTGSRDEASNKSIAKLCQWGFNLMTLESIEGLRHITPADQPGHGRIFAIDFVVPARADAAVPPPSGNPTVLVVGQVRAEKDVNRLLSHLHDICVRRGWNLQVGVPARDYAKVTAIPRTALCDTTSQSAYEAILRQADVVCVNLRQSEYEYRTSGVVADALASLRPVVVSRLCVVSRQVLHPEAVGVPFDDFHELEGSVEKALRFDRLDERFQRYFSIRTFSAARDAFWQAMDTPRQSRPLGIWQELVLKAWRVLWYVATLPVMRPVPRLRSAILNLFGARVAAGVRVYPNVRISVPWNLVMEPGSAMGDGVCCENHELVHIGRNAIISQQANLLTRRSERSMPIQLCAHSWLMANTTVFPGVVIGEGAVVGARGVVEDSLEPWRVYAGDPLHPVRYRNREGYLSSIAGAAATGASPGQLAEARRLSQQNLRPLWIGLDNRARRFAWLLTWSLLSALSTRDAFRYRAAVARLFGARLHSTARISRSARIWAPWNLTMGSDAEIHADVDIYNVDAVAIGSGAMIAAGAYLCAASHDYNDGRLPLITAPIGIECGARIDAAAFIGAGVTVGAQSVVAANSVVVRDVPANTRVEGNPAHRAAANRR